MSGNKRALVGNDSRGASFYTIYPDTKAFVRRWEASVCWGWDGGMKADRVEVGC